MSDDAKKESYERASLVQRELECALERCVNEADITYAECLGALEITKSKLLRKHFEDTEDA